MPIKNAIWRVGLKPAPLAISSLDSEKLLEDMIVASPQLLSSEWMLIGRQVHTTYGGIIDLLALAPDASLVLIELKRDRTPREVVAQALDYASWVDSLTAEKVVQIYHDFSDGGSLDRAFLDRFGVELDEQSLNESHQIALVAAELDDSTERIVNYLSERDIAINVLFFQVFQYGDQQLLSRSWLIDPRETQANVAVNTSASGKNKEPWNGEFYLNFGKDRPWDEARKYGFVCAGGGSWYSKSLSVLAPGDRIWVKIPGTGYVGVGRVADTAQIASSFNIQTSEGEKPATAALSNAASLRKHANDPEMAEYFVRVRWLDTVPAYQAVNEVGMFGNQHTLCQPTSPKWRHTIERLKLQFPNWDAKPSAPGSLPSKANR